MNKNVRYAVLHQHELNLLARSYRSPVLVFGYKPLKTLTSYTLTKYADSVVDDLNWLTPLEVLGIEDNTCGTCRVLVANRVEVDFDFSTVPGSASLTSVEISVKGAVTLAPEKLIVYIFDGLGNNEAYYIETVKAFCMNTTFSSWKDITSLIDTVAKLKAVTVRFVYSTNFVPPGAIPWTGMVDAVKIKATYLA